MSMFSEELPDELLPYKGRLTPRFYEARKQVVTYIRHVQPCRLALCSTLQD